MPKTLDWPDPIYIRLAKGGDDIVSREESGFSIGKAIIMREPGVVLFVSTGIMTQRALAAAEKLQFQGISCGVLHCHTIKPLDQQLILDLASNVELVVTVEEHILSGGLGTAVLETLHTDTNSLALVPRVLRLGLPNEFVKEYGSQNSVLQSFGLSPDLIARTTREYMG